MKINKDNIENTLTNLKGFVSQRFEESVSLSVAEKDEMFEKIVAGQRPERVSVRTPSPFMSKFGVFQYGYYVLPMIMIAVFVNYSGMLMENFSQTKDDILSNRSTIQAKMSLSKAQRDIYALKAINIDKTRTDILVTQVSTRSKEVRNRVAALVKENKISEAKLIALDLEAALKADQLYTMSPQVVEEVLAATDLRVKLEKKEVVQIALEPSATSSVAPEAGVALKIESLYKELDGFQLTEDKTELIADVKATLKKAQDYLDQKDTERAVITLQAAERIVAELRLLLVQ